MRAPRKTLHRNLQRWTEAPLIEFSGTLFTVYLNGSKYIWMIAETLGTFVAAVIPLWLHVPQGFPTGKVKGRTYVQVVTQDGIK